MPPVLTIDANEAAARVAYAVSEVAAIYPITPSSPMGEWADQWAASERKNLWGISPQIIQMQSEGGVAGALHGALQAGSMATTFTASQGLLLMLPNMYKIAGELTPFVMHVAARSLATHALSIFGDHADVMAARMTGFALLASNSVQEAQDLAAVAHRATLKSRVPFMHFFDGFRTSHEINKITTIPDEALLAMMPEDEIRAFRLRAMTPDAPVIRGTAQNPDVYFQSREACNPYYAAVPELVQEAMDRFAELTGRAYHLVDYEGAPDADRVLVVMGSGAETAAVASAALNRAGEKTGVLKVRLFRPFPAEALLNAIPRTVKSIAVLDRTKEPGAAGEPLYQDVVTVFAEAFAAGTAPTESFPRICGGRFGLSSKEFTPAMAKAVFDNLNAEAPKNHFTVGITDDVTHTSLDVDTSFSVRDKRTYRAVFYGLGSDGTVGANKNTIKIIGEETDLNAQGYFIYDSKKSGSLTVSHLRFGPDPIRAPFLITRADFVGCHQWQFIDTLRVWEAAAPGATLLLNAPGPAADVWEKLPRDAQQAIIDKQLKVFVIDALAVAEKAGMGRRINTVMQTCFFALSDVLERETAIEKIREAIRKTYGRRGEIVVERNIAAVEAALDHLEEMPVPAGVTSSIAMKTASMAGAPPFVRDVTARLIANEGDLLPVSALPPDGTFPTGTARYEKRNIAPAIPVWDPDVCIQCGKCVMACPHSVIRAKLVTDDELHDAPDGFVTAGSKWPERKEMQYTLQIAADDCTGCSLCVEVCPAKNRRKVGRKAINMTPKDEVIEKQRRDWDYFLTLPEFDRTVLDRTRVKDVQLLEPLFEFCGACAGCGETPYVRTMTQLFGDRALIANATGCSSIYGGNLPTAPWTTDRGGRGPAWSNSLFEDNAEFGLGMRVALDTQEEFARTLLRALDEHIPVRLTDALVSALQTTEAEINAQRDRVEELMRVLYAIDAPEARHLEQVAAALVRKSVWILGGDGWAYDIGFGGLDHVLASGRDVNVLVLDTEVYSNTGGQASKATARGAVAKFAAAGKQTAKKDLALHAMGYGSVYVARVAMGGNDAQTLKAFEEADAWRGPSVILAYSHCIAHGYDMAKGFEQQKAAVKSGYWPLLRYNPALALKGEAPLTLDSKDPSLPLRDFALNEARYSMLAHSRPAESEHLLAGAQEDINARWAQYRAIAESGRPAPETAPAPAQNGEAS